MGIELFETTRPSKHQFPTVSVYAKMQRFMFNIESFELLQSIAGDEPVEFVQVFVDNKDSDIFYIKPAQAEDKGSRRLGKSSKRGRFLDGKALLTKLGWGVDKLLVLRVSKNEKLKMLLIDRKEEV